ncbi:hypothetical protein CPB86DRAFT_824599 [Serendipita vermifera]|nr:hypothetical protein CPB86DRAFT_824599 [Serendipita vermifera]
MEGSQSQSRRIGVSNEWSGEFNTLFNKPRNPNVNEENLELNLRTVIERIKRSAFYVDNTLEPTVGSQEGATLLAGCCPPGFLGRRGVTGKSIYQVFINDTDNTCGLCGQSKTTNGRAISCVRAHLDHRPFCCPGPEGGCLKCGHGWFKGTARFFSKALLTDHMKYQQRKFECIKWSYRQRDSPKRRNEATLGIEAQRRAVSSRDLQKLSVVLSFENISGMGPCSWVVH